MPLEVTVPYTPRRLQAEIHAAIQSHRWTVAVCHRRFGKTVSAVNHLIHSACTTKLPRPRYALVGPTYRQIKAVAWDYCKYYSSPIPGTTINESELRIDYPNGGQLRLYGADNPDSLRGIYLDGIVLDEYGLMAANVWSEVIRPLLTDRKGWACFLGTPNGKNQFYDMVQQARAKVSEKVPTWAILEYKASQTGILSPEELASARESMTEDQYSQEFECSFEASVKGAVYARELQTAREDARITDVPYDPALPVDTNWDLGTRDATAIWFTQSAAGGVVRVIDYHEDSGYGLDHYVKVVNDKPYVYGQHWMPHDINQREFTTGKTRLELARQLLRPAVLVAPKISVDEGIHASRMVLSRCWIDRTKCRDGLTALVNYRWDFNQRVGDFSHLPLHDFASHGADAFRTFAVRYHAPKMKTMSQMATERANEKDRDPDDPRIRQHVLRRGGY